MFGRGPIATAQVQRRECSQLLSSFAGSMTSFRSIIFLTIEKSPTYVGTLELVFEDERQPRAGSYPPWIVATTSAEVCGNIQRRFDEYQFMNDDK